MKILLVSPHFFPFIGGAGNHLLRLCIGLTEKGHEIIVFTSTASKNIGKIKVYSFSPLFTYSNTPFNFWENKIDSVIKKEKPDLIAGSLSIPLMADSAARASEKNNISFFLFYFNDYVKENFFEKTFLGFYSGFVLKKTLELSKKIIVLSDYYAQKSIVLKPFKKKTVSVLPFVDFPKTKTNPVFPEKKIVLFVGSLSKGQKYKGLDYLINAFSLLESDVLLVVVGKGNNQHFFESLAEKKGLKEKIVFLGEIPEEKLLSLYSECKTLVLPSVNDSEGFGLALLEAMSFGKPVIGTNTGGIPAVIKHNFNGFLVEPKNSVELSNAIQSLLSDEKKAKQLGLNAFNSAKNFSKQESINKLIQVFGESIEKTK